MKRFWTDVRVAPSGTGFGVTLDGRPVRTPARAELVLPNKRLADAVAVEWAEQAEEINPRAMPLTGLANVAIDHAGAELAQSLARYGESDLLYYRAEGPRPLVERQSAAWDPLLQWARMRFDLDFATGAGVIHLAQPEATVRILGHAVAVLDRFRLAALAPLVTIGGSLIAGLAVIERAIDPDAVWAAVSLDEAWQAEQWGVDAEADVALEARCAEFLAAARFAELLD